MKALPPTLAFSLALLLATLINPARAQDYAPPTFGQDNVDDQTGASAIPGESASTPTGSISFQQFYNDLGQYGTWINTDKYGYVFQPTETDPNWAPYTNGRWVNTDAGLTWSGNDPFSWATDHYGRWVNLANYGWVWVPGYTWGPGWVSWRQADDNSYVGWAPLPPDSDMGIDYYGDNDPDDYGYHIGDDADLYYGIGPWWYTFVPTIWFGDPYCYRHYWHRGDNFARIGHTRNVTNINFTRGDRAGRFGSVHAAGPSIASLNARSQTPVQNVSLARASTLDNAGLRSGTLSVFAPSVDPSTRATTRPANASGSVQGAQINRGTDISRGLAVNSHLDGAAATADQVRAANDTRSGFDHARVATSATQLSRGFSGSFNAVRTAPSAPAAFGENEVRASAFGASPSVNGGGSRFSAENPGRVFSSTPNAHIYNAPAYSTFRAEPSTPGYGYHAYTPNASSYRAYTPSYHSFSTVPSFHSAPSFSGGAHFSGGGFSGGGAHYSGGGGGFSGGGGHAGGGGGHR
jgi:hypothetical protein